MYRYYSAIRPIVPGGYPKTEPIHKIVNFDEKQLILSIDKRVWGYIEYERPLTAADAADYDLLPEIPYENKAKICRLLCKVIQQTRDGSDLLSLTYDAEHEMVAAHFKGACRAIHVAGDSGMAMIQSIIKHIGI